MIGGRLNSLTQKYSQKKCIKLRKHGYVYLPNVEDLSIG
jgi:hypothetical protein